MTSCKGPMLMHLLAYAGGRSEVGLQLEVPFPHPLASCGFGPLVTAVAAKHPASLLSSGAPA